ncbi:MAG: zf-HC2 domain-containing protein [Candidatus Eremiobacteraeota bacterium]|nr:zf-HC2 domain-containing protein [Candidatus Eremiobacteraeota bacterium]
MTQHPYDEIEAFALGSLDDQTQRAVLDHADTCPSCAVLLADAMSGLGALAALETPRPLERDLALPFTAPAVAARVTPLRRVSLSAWAAFAAAAACLALLFWNVQLCNEAISVPVGALVHSHFIHHALRGPSASAKAIQAVDGHWVYVVADGLSPGARYVVWETRAGATTRASTLTANRNGQATAYMEQTAGAIDAVALAPEGKDPSDPSALRWP